MTQTPWHTHRSRRGLRALGVTATLGGLLLGVGACTSGPDDGGTGASSGAPAATSPAASEPAASGPPASASNVGPLSPVPLTVAAGTEAGAADGRSLNLPAGWSAEVWADVPGARLAAWAPDGRLVVSTGDRGVVSILTPSSAGRAPTTETLLDGLDNPQGLAFAEQDGRTILVVGEGPRLAAWDYADGAVTDRRVIVDGLPDGGHGSKAVAVQDGVVYYNVGSATNSDPVDRTSDQERGIVARVGLDGTGNRTIGTGIRNGFALSFAPDDTLFVAVNQADNQPYPFQDDTGQYGQVVPEYVNENPVDQVARITPGTELGWPYCVPDIRGSDDLTDLPYVNHPANPDGEALDCADIGTTMLGLPAHSAPLGITFTHDADLPEAIGNGALITAHGSWNREPPRAPSVVYSAWDDATGTLGAPVDLVTGFQDEDGSRWGRSVMAVPGPDGSIYVTDDEAGLVYRLTPS
ncbi:PQQ-dependent sugar dehydrogenase [Promicromonospora sp. NPDC057138]|uniref:PQQ-dependent sugar dehydrogenase n=1 Tax=Promicromonospora sp. NPDC057138 TaxID=3346031 RepID=UPI0036299FC5